MAVQVLASIRVTKHLSLILPSKIFYFLFLVSASYFSLALLQPTKPLCAFLRICSTTALADPSPQSLIDFTPREEDYQLKVRPLVPLIKNSLENKNPKGFAEAVAEGNSLLKTTPRGYHDEIYQLIAYALEKQGKVQEALLSYEKSLALKKSDPLTLFRHALLLKKMGRCDEAVIELREVMWRMERFSHEALFVAAECLLSQGKEEEARIMIDKAYQKNPRFLPVLKLLVNMREEQLSEEPDPEKREVIISQIMNDLQAISQLEPENREFNLKYAKLLITRSDPLVNPGSLSLAEEKLRKLSEGSHYKDEESVKALFDALAKQGKLDEAEDILEKGIEALGETTLLKAASTQLSIERGI